MRLIKAAAATVNQTPLDWAGNLARIAAAIDAARNGCAQILVLPELALTGYGCEDAFHGLAHTRRAARHLLELASAVPDDLVVVAGAPVRLQHGLYNGACFLTGGRIAGIVAKQHLAGDGVHYEPRWFRSWTRGAMSTADFDGVKVPIGDFVLNLGGVRIGAEICEDAWVPNRPAIDLARAGADVIVNMSASHFSFGKWGIRERIAVEGSRATGAAYIYANALGNEAGRVIFDGQRVIVAGGDVVARSGLFTFREMAMTTAIFDLDTLRMRRARFYSLKASDAAMKSVEVPFEWKSADGPASKPLGVPADWLGSCQEKEEEFTRAVSLGLFDYLRKSRSRGFVVSLSGGADSTATAALATLALRFAVEELGEEEVRRRLPQADLDFSKPCAGILDTIYQATENSSDTTRNAARTVAKALGANHAEWNVDEQVATYRASVEQAIGRQLDWEADDIALQNIQARVRSPGIWMLANVRHSLLLSTSNRSEAAVGYATMDGDTSGSISPIAGIDKNYLRRWLAWLAEKGPAGIGPIPEVQVVVEIPPTAELRPQERRQTDEDDLMPYDLLDAIERLAIRDRMEPGEVREALEPEWADRVGGMEKLTFYITRFFTLWARNQWKRERYAPSFHLDDENLDPKTWCRFPILSGGFHEELGEL